MRLVRIETTNFRTLANLSIQFPKFYTAICGKNDSGKTNIVKALRKVVRDDNVFEFGSSQGLSLLDDYPRWLSKKNEGSRKISIVLDIEIMQDDDPGLYEFITTYLKIENENPLKLTIGQSYGEEASSETVWVTASSGRLDGSKAQPVLDHIQKSSAILFYDSPSLDRDYRYSRSYLGFFREHAGKHLKDIESTKQVFNKKLKKIAKDQERQLTELMGRIESRFKVSMSVPLFDPSSFPFEISLAIGQDEVNLDQWGSGTRNRTQILLTLFRAQQIKQSGLAKHKVTPVIVVEEPECYLHPSAQAQFGHVLQAMCEEFKVQVIATTHSPYLLNIHDPTSNILLARREFKKQYMESEVLDTTGASWATPYASALGVEDTALQPFHGLFLGKKDQVIFVEGETDAKYLELLQSECHRANRLDSRWRIVAYNGADILKNSHVLSFIRKLCGTFVITYDLDARERLHAKLREGGISDAEQVSIGIDAPGKQNIEGLVPVQIKQKVNADNEDLISQLGVANSDQRQSVWNRLKAKYLTEFQSNAKIPEDYQEFYKLVRHLNQRLKTSK